MPVDLTSPWIPLSIIMLLGIFMVYQFIQERKTSRALALEEASAAAQPAPVPAAPSAGAAAVAASTSSAPEAKKKMRLRWRTAWIWLPFLIGFFGQAYLSFIKPMLENAG